MTEQEVARRAAPVLARMLARAKDLGFVVDADTPAPVERRPDVATALPVAAWGTRSSVGVDHGAWAAPVAARPDGPGADTPK